MAIVSRLSGNLAIISLFAILELHFFTGCEKTVELQVEEEVLFPTEYKKAPCLRPGEEFVEQEGEAGLANVKIEKRFKGEEIRSEREISRAIIKEPVPKIILRGEKEILEFSGNKWIVKSGKGLAPGPNTWCSDNVEMDAAGHLLLKLNHTSTMDSEISKEWHCAELRSEESFGYGEYRWIIESGLKELHRNLILGLFTYLDDSHEIDIEFGKWGNRNGKNGQFAVQPASNDSLYRFNIPEGIAIDHGITASFIWKSNSIEFRCYLGEVLGSDYTVPLLAEWIYTGPKIPKPGNKHVHINLWLIRGMNGPTENTEISLTQFIFTPLPQVKPVPVVKTWGKPGVTVWVEEDGRTVSGLVQGLSPDKVGKYKIKIYAYTDIWYRQPYGGSIHDIDPYTMFFNTWTRSWSRIRADLVLEEADEVIAEGYYP